MLRANDQDGVEILFNCLDRREKRKRGGPAEARGASCPDQRRDVAKAKLSEQHNRGRRCLKPAQCDVPRAARVQEAQPPINGTEAHPLVPGRAPKSRRRRERGCFSIPGLGWASRSGRIRSGSIPNP